MSSSPDITHDLDAILHVRGAYAADADAVPWRRLLAVMTLCAGIYGMLMGGTAGIGQMALSAAKIPLLIGVSTMICLPSLFMVNTVSGLRRDFGAVLRGVLAAQTTVAITLAALAPFLLLTYASTSSYQLTKAINGVLFLVASIAGQCTLSAHYRPLVAVDPRHRTGRRVWWFLYVLVTIQVAWVLRPFIGAPGLPLQLFREAAWGNAYVQVWELVLQTLGWN